MTFKWHKARYFPCPYMSSSSITSLSTIFFKIYFQGYSTLKQKHTFAWQQAFGTADNVLLETHTSHIRVSQLKFCFFLIACCCGCTPWQVAGGRCWFLFLDFYHAYGKPGLSCVLALAWPSPSFCGHESHGLENCFHLSLCLSDKQTVVVFSNSYNDFVLTDYILYIF